MKGGQSFSDPPSNGGEQELGEIHRELEETKFAKERLEIELRSALEISENRKRVLDDTLSKLQEKKQQLEKQSQELNKRAEEIDITNQKYEKIKATLVQKESTLRGVNSAYEQLRDRFNEMQKNMDNENRGLVKALDDANNKCEEQERGIKKYVGEIENLRCVIANLQKKCSNAEAVAEEKTNRMRQLETELDAKGATIAVFSENKSHYDVLKMRLAECERNLAQESAQRASAEQALVELKSRDRHLLKVEKEHSNVQEQLKWKKEQFGLLEEAYKKLQKQFQYEKDDWEKEKSGLISEISTLKTNLDTQFRLSKDVQSQLQSCNQALAHEESRRKVLEMQVEDSRCRYEQTAAESERARSIIETLRKESSREVGYLRDSLAFKERQMREMEVKQIHMEQENQELKNMVEEFQASKSCSEEVRSSLQGLKVKYVAVEEAYKECCETLKTKESQWEKERDEMFKTLNDCQMDLRSKDGKVHELQIQLEGAHASAERLTCQKAELSQRMLILESQYQDAQSKLSAENLTLESLYKRKNEEVACLKEQLEAKQKAFEQIQQKLMHNQKTIETMSAKCESVEVLEKQCSVIQEELSRKQEQLQSLSKLQGILQDEIHEKEQIHTEEVRKVREALEEASSCICAKEQREKELQNELRRLQEVIEKTQASHLASEIKAEEYEHQLQALQQEILTANHALVLSEEKTKSDKASFLDAIKARDKKIEELKGQIGNFEQSLIGLSQQEETLLRLQSQYKQLSDQRMKELEYLGVTNAKLESIAKELLDKEEERDFLLKCLESKEADLGKLKKESEALFAEKTAIIDSIKVQEEKYKKLNEENEQNKLDLQQACVKLEIADSVLTVRDRNIAQLQQKLKHGEVLHQELSGAEQKMQKLECMLEEARTSLHDKEEKISEFEITVEQLRNEVLVIRLELAEKEKDGTILEGKLRDAEKEVRAKEDQLLEMDSNLNSILRETEEKQAEILCLRDEMKEMEKKLSDSEERHSDTEDQLKSVRAIIEEKVAALNVAELELQRERNALEETKDAIENLKFQLTNEEKISFDRQFQIDHLFKDMDRTKMAEKQASASLKDVQGRLEQLEQESKDQISKLQDSITELQCELSAKCINMKNSEIALKYANEELVSCNEKCTTLVQLLSAKDEALKAKERNISSLQTDILQQADIIRKGELDLQIVQDRLLGELESQHNLEKTVSLFRDQVAELQECNQELENKLNDIHRDYQAALKTLIDRDACTSHLEKNLKIYVGQLEEFSVAAGNREQNISELLEKFHLSEGKIEALEKQAFQLQWALEGAVDCLKEETDNVSSLSLSFDELKTQLAEIKFDTVSGLKDGMTYAAELKDVIKVLDNFQLKLDIIQKRESDLASRLVSLEELLEESQSGSTMQAKQIDLLAETVKDLDSQLLEWKSKATNSAEVAYHIQLELDNANQVISYLQEQLDGCKLIQEGSKEVETSAISFMDIDGLKKDLEHWKATAMSATEETKNVSLQIKLSEDNVRELSPNIEAYENSKCDMEKQYSLLEEKIQNLISGLSDEMDKFYLFCSSVGEQNGEVEKIRQEALLNHRELRDMLSSVKDELNGFKSSKGQFGLQSYDIKLQTMEGQLSVLQSDIDKEREKVNSYAKLMEEAEMNLAFWKDKVDVVDCQNKALQTEVELLNRSFNELREEKEQVMTRERQLQDELSALQEYLHNINSNFVEETGRSDSLLNSVKSMEEERNNLLEKIRSITEENTTTKLELDAAKTELSQLSLNVGAGGEHLKNLEQMNKKLRCELSAAHEEIKSRKDFVQKLLCQLHNMQVQGISHRVHLQAIQDRILANKDVEGALVECPRGGVRDATEDFEMGYASLWPLDMMEVAQNTHENVPGAVDTPYFNQDAAETKTELSLINKDTATTNSDLMLYGDGRNLQVCDVWQKIQGKQVEEKVQELMKELETALMTLAGKNAGIEKLNREFENMQALVKKLEQRNSQLEQYKDSSTIDTGRYFQYTELCDSLIREQLRLKKKLEMAERKNHVLVGQIEEIRQSMQARTPEDTNKDRTLNEKQDENFICTPKPRLQTDVGSGHGSSERSPLKVLNC